MGTLACMIPASAALGIQLLTLAILSDRLSLAGALGTGAILASTLVCTAFPTVSWVVLIGVILILSTGFVYGPQRGAWGWAILGGLTILAIKQLLIRDQVPVAAETVSYLLLMGMGMGAGVTLGGERLGLLLAGAIVLGKGSWKGEKEQRYHEQIEIVALQAGTWEGIQLAAKLVALRPQRDEAAQFLPLETAIRLGWRPQRADWDPVGVARALEQHGRGGEAWRMLKRHPRAGALDGYMAILERTQSLPVRWKGSMEGLVRPGELGWDFQTNGVRQVELITDPGLLYLTGQSTGFDRPTRLSVALNATPQTFDLDSDFTLLIGKVERGPQRVTVHFSDDASEGQRDRNVSVKALVLESKIE